MTRSTHPRRVRFVAPACLLLTAGTIVLTASPQNPPPRDGPVSQQAPPVGTSRITGTVVASDNGAPVKRATISIMGRPAMVPPSGGRGAVSTVVTSGVVGSVLGGLPSAGPPGGQFPSQVTDDAGRFEFGELPAGVYSLMVSPRSGFVRPQRVPQVEVEDGKTATLALRLDRTGVITGRLLDDTGEPLPRARVSAMRRERAAGGRLMSAGMGDTTDDLGQFRLFDLPPGEYLVSGSDIGYGGANVAGPSQGYAPTYFPGTPSLDGARVLVVKSGQETPGVEFSLVRVAMGRITGTVRDSTGQTVTTRASVSLSRRSDDALGFGRGAGVRPDGTFVITDVPPGDYFISAMLQGAEGPNPPREGAYVPVSVNGNDTSVDIQTNKGATIRGHVIIEGTPPPMPTEAQMPPGMARMSVMARPWTAAGPIGMAMGMSRPATVAEDGTFELTGVRGPVLLTASGMRMALKSVTRGAQDVTSQPMEFRGTELVSNVTVVLTYDVGTLEGTVTDERGEPLPGASVIIFTEDESRWFQGSPFVHFTRAIPAMAASTRQPSTTQAPGMPPGRKMPVPGSFITSALLPGRYLVAAVDAEGMPPTDRESLERLRKHAVIATVSAGAPASVQLRALKNY